jgi:hypothetical protein
MGNQLYILPRMGPDGEPLPALGTRNEVLAQLAAYNTAPERDDDDSLLYGPGIRIEVPPADPVAQMILTFVEDEIAWQVIERVAPLLHWRLFDPETGREYAP